MEEKILEMDYVIKNGIDYDEFESEMFTDRLLDIGEEEGGRGFSGLVYESIDENQISGYYYYYEGYGNGQQVDYYYNRKVRKVYNMKNGIIDGLYREWNEKGILIEEGEYKLGKLVKRKKWDDKGVLLEVKDE